MASVSGGLDLLKSYGSESSDEEVIPGPRVSTKRTVPNDFTDHESKKHSRETIKDEVVNRLPLPESLLSLFPPKDEMMEDNPAEHGGRIRSFPYERGNWATYVYIHYDRDHDLKSLITDILTLFESFIPLEPVEDLHISLTRTVILRYHWIDTLVSSFREAIKDFSSFCIQFSSFEVYCNEEKTRTFIGLEIQPHPSLFSIVKELDRCLAEFKLPPFYEDPSFHLSVAWCVGDHKEEIARLLPHMQQDIFLRFFCENPILLTFNVKQLFCKTGNKHFVFHLKT